VVIFRLFFRGCCLFTYYDFSSSSSSSSSNVLAVETV